MNGTRNKQQLIGKWESQSAQQKHNKYFDEIKVEKVNFSFPPTQVKYIEVVSNKYLHVTIYRERESYN